MIIHRERHPMTPDMILYNLYYNMDFSHGKPSLNAIKLSTKYLKIMLQRTCIKNLSYYNIFRLHETRSSRHHEIPKGETASSRSLLNDMFKHLAARRYENKDSIDQILPGSHDPRGKFIFERMLGITIFYSKLVVKFVK